MSCARFSIDATRLTPAYRHYDGLDYVPTNRYVLFGHHFAAIAGAGPLVGPVLAAQMGYLPGTLWILAGVVFAGAGSTSRGTELSSRLGRRACPSGRPSSRGGIRQARSPLHRAQRHAKPIDPRPRLGCIGIFGRATRHADQLSWNWIRVVHALRWCRGDSSKRLRIGKLFLEQNVYTRLDEQVAL